MTRFLRRATAADEAETEEAPAAETPAPRRRRAATTRAAKSAKAGAETPEAPELPKEPAPRRARKRAAAEPSPAPAKRAAARSTAKTGAARRAADAQADEAAAPAKRTGRAAAKSSPAAGRSSAKAKQDAAEPADAGQAALLQAIQQQNQILADQQKAIAQLADAQTRLAAALSGGGADAALGAQVEVLPRLAIFVDVPNILYAAEASGVRLDWGKVADFLARGRTLVRAIAYAPISDDPQARTENERFVVPFIEHGYRIATKPLKRFTGGSVKANFDVELAIDVLTMADRIDVIVLVSGDGDFRRLVEIVGSRGVRVEVMAFGQSTSSDLRQVADRYVDIAAHIPALTA